MGLFDPREKTTKRRSKKIKRIASEKPFTPRGISVNEPLVTRRAKKVRPLF